MNPKELPVYKEKERILEAVKNNQVVIVESPTGSGKTTQLPLILNEAGYTTSGVIGITQPRRIATLSVSEYMAKQLKTTIPGYVGYKMRFDDQTVPTTALKIMTDGILLQEVKNDPLLSAYSVIIVDEAHERSLNIDFVLGLLKSILRQRADFKVIISSATLNTQSFSDYFFNAPIISIETKPYPVNLMYHPLKSDNTDELIRAITETVERNVINKEKGDGDFLIFLSGEKLIKDTVTALESSIVNKKLLVIPLYGRLSKEEQEKIFVKTPLFKTKVVVSTNIAETSVTIDGITCVLDSGLSKLNYYNPHTFTSSLIENSISKASADQRKGRAGRTAPGTCYRFYSKKDYELKDKYTPEEIFRTDLSEVVLRMSEIGIRDFHSFDFLSSPGKQGITGAVKTLQQFGALNSDNSLSSIGEMMVQFPLLPRHSRMIVESILRYPNVLNEVIIATSFISTRSPYALPPGEEIDAREAHASFGDENGDFSAYLKLFKMFNQAVKKDKFCKRFYLDEKIMFEIVNIHEQLSSIISEMGIPISLDAPFSFKEYIISLSAGLIQFIGAKTGRGIYRTPTTDKVIIHPGSVLFREKPDFIVAGEIVKTSRMYARSVSPLKKQWIKDISQDLYLDLITGGIMKGSNNKRERERETHKTKKDTTNQIYLGEYTFPIKQFRGNKYVEFNWFDIKPAVESIKWEEIPSLGNLRGELKFKNFVILKEAKVNKIFKAVKLINPESEIIMDFPSETFHINSLEDVEKLLIPSLKYVMNLTPVSKKKKSKNELGFLSLNTDNNGTYWFKSTKRFNTALNQSTEAISALANSSKNQVKPDSWSIINRVYSKLDSFYL
ncbi:ATP-dependent RNA helicase [Thiospirochaeta perfilievii]|uniref:RNA helicase n=1 Tax=Thiospirochaeta perfilievii TaxID=252967 RepID=A0A5C1QC65_9SPIO|nr:ATP-dependent RNA helicase [Thiospirochaeta perfilievii]QEN05695.1 ATP-dependent RNA helicase [Thiospirochaeta perfilievii]